MLNDIKPLFYGARFYGCSPHRITDSELTVTKSGMIHFVLVSIVFAYVFCYHMYSSIEDCPNMNVLLVVMTRSILGGACTFVDGIITMLWNYRLTLVFDHFRAYDIAAKFENRNNYTLRNCCRISMFIATILCFTTGYVTYICKKSNAVLTGFLYAFYYGGITLQILKFYGMMVLLYQRFHHLSRLIIPKESIGLQMSFRTRARRSVKLQDAWWMHCSLTMAAEEINKIYSAQLFLWIALMFLNGLSRFYTIFEGGINLHYVEIRDAVIATTCMIHLILITAFCHMTSYQANRIADEIFSARSVIYLKPRIVKDNLDAAMYFTKTKLRFTAAIEFISIDLPLLLSITGGITTYVVILHKSANEITTNQN